MEKLGCFGFFGIVIYLPRYLDCYEFCMVIGKYDFYTCFMLAYLKLFLWFQPNAHTCCDATNESSHISFLWIFSLQTQMMIVTSGAQRGSELISGHQVVQEVMMMVMARHKVLHVDHRVDTQVMMCQWLIKQMMIHTRCGNVHFQYNILMFSFMPSCVLTETNLKCFHRMNMMRMVSWICIVFKELWGSGSQEMKCGGLLQGNLKTSCLHIRISKENWNTFGW